MLPPTGFIFFLLTTILISCNKTSDHVDLNYENLKPGTEYWYRIVRTDSVINVEEQIERKRSERSIRFTVLDTTDLLTIEWWEQHWLPYETDSFSLSLNGEWVSMYRIEYELNEYGEIVNVSNYDEVRSQIDPLLDRYISEFDSTIGVDIRPYLGGFLDSSWMMNALLSDASILHRLHGVSISKGDTLVLFTHQEGADEAMMPFYLIQKIDPICADGQIPIIGWASMGTVDIDKFLDDKVPKRPGGDTLAIGKAIGQEQMKACFDTTISLPTYIELRRSIELNEDSLIQTRHIYLQE